MITLYRSEASASLRRIPLWLVGSNGTSPATGEAAGQPQIYWVARNTLAATGATLSLVSANAGEYYVELTASEVSQLGLAEIQYRSATALPNSIYFQITNVDSGDSVRLGLVSLPNAAAAASGGLITVGTGTGQLNVSAGSVGLLAATHSGVTIQGLSNYANISNVTLAAGTHSNVTIQGLSNYANISNVTLAAGTHSNVTIQGLSNYANISNVTLAAGTHSGATVGVGGIALGSYSGVTVEVSNIAQSMRSLIADDLLRRDIAAGAFGGRSVQEALRVLRNKVDLSSSVMTVYSEDDATSSWTASITTSAAATPIITIDPR